MRLVVPLCVAMCALAGGQHPARAQSASGNLLLTENEALARQQAFDPRIRAIRARAASVRAAQSERTRWPNPVAAYSRERAGDTSDLFLVGRQDFPVFGRMAHLRAAGRLAVDVADAETTFEVVDRQAALRRTFAVLLGTQEQVTVLEAAVLELRRLVEILRIREEAGEGSRYDRLRGERAVVDLDNERDAAAIARERARIALAAFLGPETTAEGLVAAGSLGQPPPPPLADLVARALETRADYRASELTAAQFEAERRAARTLRLPSPSVGYGLKRSGIGSALDNGYQLSVDVAVPLFNRGQSAVALAEAEHTRVSLEGASLRLLVESEVRSAHVTLMLERDRADRYRQSVGASAEPLTAIARIAYDEGEAGILELLDAHRQLLDARLEMLNLDMASRLAAIELDRVAGVEARP
jgi:outer membrane protein, heavy metal efflux system